MNGPPEFKTWMQQMLTIHKWMFSLIDAFALVTSSLSRFARLWRVHRVTTSPCDDFTVTSSLLWRVHRVTSSLCDEFTCNPNDKSPKCRMRIIYFIERLYQQFSVTRTFLLACHVGAKFQFVINNNLCAFLPSIHACHATALESDVIMMQNN